jgi:hypothetical protein
VPRVRSVEPMKDIRREVARQADRLAAVQPSAPVASMGPETQGTV